MFKLNISTVFPTSLKLFPVNLFQLFHRSKSAMALSLCAKQCAGLHRFYLFGNLFTFFTRKPSFNFLALLESMLPFRVPPNHCRNIERIIPNKGRLLSLLQTICYFCTVLKNACVTVTNRPSFTVDSQDVSATKCFSKY